MRLVQPAWFLFALLLSQNTFALGAKNTTDAKDVLLRFTAAADLAPAERLESREQRLRFVYGRLKAVAEKSQAEAVALLRVRGVEHQAFYVENAIHIPEASTELLRELSHLRGVGQIESNGRLKAPSPRFELAADLPRGIEDSLTTIGAVRVWEELKVRGEGIVIAGQDTGFDWRHPSIRRQYRGQSEQNGAISHDYNWHDSVHSGGGKCGANSGEPCDDGSHGTHTMGTMLGDDGNGNRTGVAPGARWIGCRNMNVGDGTVASYLECFEFFLAPYPRGGDPRKDGRPELAPHIVNNSWGCPKEEGCSGNEFLEAVRAYKAAGILVVAAVGNDGPSCGTIGVPPGGYNGEVLGVAALNHRSGAIAGFSSRGPSSWNGGVGIDVSAPGVSIRSSVPGGRFASMSGTSMASPHMAGAAALLWQARPELRGKVAETIAVFRSTAKPLISTQACGRFAGSSVPNAVFGHGLVDVFKAAGR